MTKRNAIFIRTRDELEPPKGLGSTKFPLNLDINDITPIVLSEVPSKSMRARPWAKYFRLTLVLSAGSPTSSAVMKL